MSIARRIRLHLRQGLWLFGMKQLYFLGPLSEYPDERRFQNDSFVNSIGCPTVRGLPQRIIPVHFRDVEDPAKRGHVRRGLRFDVSRLHHFRLGWFTSTR